MKKTIFLIFTAITFLGSCSKREDDTSIIVAGNWLSTCVDFGGGSLNKIYIEISPDGAQKLAILTYASAPCSGTYTMTDNSSNSITAPADNGTLAIESVTGIPDKFYVAKSTDTSGGIGYNVFYFNTDDFYSLGTYTTTHSDWTTWLTETDVTGFSQAPTTFTPTSKLLIHLEKTTSLP